jgi:predicted nuclease of predicted toxin-antitoxin system
MRFLVDENLSSPHLASRLQAQGHDPVLASDVGLLSVTDARALIFAIAQLYPY